MAAEPPTLLQVPTDRVASVLQLVPVAQLLEDLCQRHEGELSVRGIQRKVMSLEWQLWLIWDSGDSAVRAVLATELYHDIGGDKRCRIPFCTGTDASRWVSLIEEIEEWARRNGCVRIDMIARKGWARRLPSYKMTHVVLEKAL